MGLNMATRLQIALGLISSGSVTVNFVHACLCVVQNTAVWFALLNSNQERFCVDLTNVLWRC